MKDGKMRRLTLRLGQRLSDLILPPQCQLIQEAHLWAALEFGPLQIQFLQICGLRSPDGQVVVPFCRFRIEEGRLIRVITEEDDQDLISGIPVAAVDGIMFDVLVEDSRENLLPRLTEKQLDDVQNVWESIASNGEEKVSLEIARSRIRKRQMNLVLDSSLANPSLRRLIEELCTLQSGYELEMWESLDIRHTGFLTMHDLILGESVTLILPRFGSYSFPFKSSCFHLDGIRHAVLIQFVCVFSVQFLQAWLTLICYCQASRMNLTRKWIRTLLIPRMSLHKRKIFPLPAKRKKKMPPMRFFAQSIVSNVASCPLRSIEKDFGVRKLLIV
jgi:hypothetical protein